MSLSPERTVIEDVPKQLLRFACGGTLLARLVDKVAADKERSMTRALIIAEYGLYVCHTNGRVSRFVIFSSVVQISVFGLSIMIRSLGQSDLLLSLNPHRGITSNDPQVVIDLLHRKCRDASRDYRRVDAPSYTALVKECILTLENPVDSQPDVAQIKLDASTAVATQQLASSVVMLSKTKEQESSMKSPVVTSRADVKARIVELYKKHNPGKVNTVDALMNEFRGREAMLLNGIRIKYEGGGSAVTAIDDDAIDRPGELVEERAQKVGMAFQAGPSGSQAPGDHVASSFSATDVATTLNSPQQPALPTEMSPSVSPPHHSPSSTDSSSGARRTGTSTSAGSFPSPDQQPLLQASLIQGVDVVSVKRNESSTPHQSRTLTEQRAALGIAPRLFTPGKSFLSEPNTFLPVESREAPQFEELEYAANAPAGHPLKAAEATRKVLPRDVPADRHLLPSAAVESVAQMEAAVSPQQVVGDRLASDSILQLLRRSPAGASPTGASMAGAAPAQIMSPISARSDTPKAALPPADNLQVMSALTRQRDAPASQPQSLPKMPIVPHDIVFAADELSRCAIGLLVSRSRSSSAGVQPTLRLPSTVGFLDALRRHAADAELMHMFKYDLSTTVKLLELVDVSAGQSGTITMPRLFLEAFLQLWCERHGFYVMIATGDGLSRTIPAAPRALCEHIQRTILPFSLSLTTENQRGAGVGLRMGSIADPSTMTVAAFAPRDVWDISVDQWNATQQSTLTNLLLLQGSEQPSSSAASDISSIR